MKTDIKTEGPGKPGKLVAEELVGKGGGPGEKRRGSPMVCLLPEKLLLGSQHPDAN